MLPLAVHLCAFTSLLAQGTTQLNGTITDPSGAGFPNAKVEIVNSESGLKRTTNADLSGNYVFAQIAPGNYSLTAQASGFSSAVVNNVRLLVNTPATVAVKMEVGAVSESVSITAEALLLNTTDATIGNSFGTKPTLQLPFEGRNVVEESHTPGTKSPTATAAETSWAARATRPTSPSMALT